MSSIVDVRITKIQQKVAIKREAVARRKARLNAAFLGLYAIGSLVVLSGGFLEAVQSTRPGEAQDGSKAA